MNYTQKVTRRNAEADSALLGVRLGRLCIANKVSVHDVAAVLGVSRMVVYRWFAGRNDVNKHLRSKVQIYHDSLASVKNTNVQLCLDLTT